MNAGPKRHRVADPAISFCESSHDPNCSFDAVEEFPLVEVSHHAPDVNGPVTMLGEFPVNDEQRVEVLACGVREQDTRFKESASVIGLL